MPGTELEVAALDAETTDPLIEVLAQVGEGESPVMVLGLERAVPMASDDAPILRALNLERSEWPERLRRPVVFWIPEALLGALGRTAPDFLEWRSDTLHFPSESARTARELLAFDQSLWQGRAHRSMRESDRRARIEELRARLRLTRSSTDSKSERTRALWLFELGTHLLFLGETEAAQEHYLEVLEVAEKAHDRPVVAAVCHELGCVAQERGQFEKALRWYRKSLVHAEELGDRSAMAASYHGLGNLAFLQGRDAMALDRYRSAMEILEELGDRHGVAASYHQLGIVALEMSCLDESLEWFRKSLELSKELGDRTSMAATLMQLGTVAHAQGSYEEALALYRNSLQVFEELGYAGGIVRSSSQIGIALTEADRAEEAILWSLRALAIRLEIARSYTWIDLDSLRRQRQALGDRRFRELVDEHAESPDLVAYVLEATAEPIDEPAQEVAEAPADYGAGGRSDDGD